MRGIQTAHSDTKHREAFERYICKVLQFWGFCCCCHHTLKGQRHGGATWLWQNVLGMLCARSKHAKTKLVRSNKITTKRGSGFQCGNCVIAWQFSPDEKHGGGHSLVPKYTLCVVQHSLGGNNSQGSNVTPPRFNVSNFKLGSFQSEVKFLTSFWQCNEFD